MFFVVQRRVWLAQISVACICTIQAIVQFNLVKLLAKYSTLFSIVIVKIWRKMYLKQLVEFRAFYAGKVKPTPMFCYECTCLTHTCSCIFYLSCTASPSKICVHAVAILRLDIQNDPFCKVLRWTILVEEKRFILIHGVKTQNTKISQVLRKLQ